VRVREIWEVAAKDFDVFGRYRLPLSASLVALAVTLRQLKQQTKGSGVATRRFACSSQQDRLQPRYASRAAVFGHRNLLSDDLANNVGARLNPQRTSTRIAALPWLEPAVFRGAAIADAIVEEADGDLMGDGVNIAARLESIAKPGAICLSEDTYRQVKGRRGHRQVKRALS
jgi:hypothetical protein